MNWTMALELKKKLCAKCVTCRRFDGDRFHPGNPKDTTRVAVAAYPRDGNPVNYDPANMVGFCQHDAPPRTRNKERLEEFWKEFDKSAVSARFR